MLYIGCHLSVSNGYKAMAEEALKLDANTLQFFTRNPRGSKAKDIDENDCNSFVEIANKNNFSKVVAHAPYTLNPSSPDDRTREFAKEVMADDLMRMEYLPGNLYDFHPGSHVKQGVDTGIEYTANMLNQILKLNQSTIVLLETMAGKGSEIGKTFQELKQILDRVELQEKMGVCFDTCHVYDAGYDIVNNLDGVLEEFDKIIGLDKLFAIHLNDSKNPMGSHKDRHEKIGKGYIGIDAIARVINHPSLKHLPFILETPNDLEGYREEIKLLRSLYNG
ncbi:deoxyribonuclease IV [Thermoanaerobacterium thermosulfurigenes]|uniref:deoxyribonuclease IV n=1 Tax=Thermoanaerobacterium thermosulfurigenes TaxID=33950 RepID=UPI003EF4355F